MTGKDLYHLLDLNNKTAVITGGATGIGAAAGQILARAGAAVIIADINTAKGEEICRRMTDTGSTALFFRCDVTRESDCIDLARFIQDSGRGVDILFNNAGVIVRKSVTDLAETEWNTVVDVSMKGAFLVSKHLIPLMIPQGSGAVINTGSGWSLKAGADAAAYCAAKAGILNLTRAMAIDYGKYNIRVNCVCPGDTDTGLLRDEARQLGEDEDRFLEEAADRPLGRMGTPEDIARAVLFLASPMSEWVSGTSLLVDGGGLA